MSEFMRNRFPLKSIELPCFKNGHVPHRMSPHLDTVFIDVLIVDEQSILLRFFGCLLLLINLNLDKTRAISSSVLRTPLRLLTTGAIFGFLGLWVVTSGNIFVSLLFRKMGLIRSCLSISLAFIMPSLIRLIG